MYAEAVLKKHLPSEQSAVLTPAFSSSSPALLPKKPVSGWVFPVTVSATAVRYLYLQLCLCHSGFNSLFIPAAVCLPACRCPPALPRSSWAACPLSLPGHCCARFMLPPPKGILVQVSANCSSCWHGKAGGAAVSNQQTELSWVWPFKGTKCDFCW